MAEWPFKILLMLFEVAVCFPLVFCLSDSDRRNTEEGEAHVAVGLTAVCLTLSRSTILYLLLLSCYHIRTAVFDKCHCLLPFCPTRFSRRFPLLRHLIWPLTRFQLSMLRRRLISIKSPFDLGLSGAPATTAVQSLWYGGFKIGFKAGLNSPGLVCAGQGCPA